MSVTTVSQVPAQRSGDGAPVCRFPVLTWAQVCERVEAQSPFLVPGLVCSTLTLLIGEPEAGKSSVAAALMAAALRGKPFLGRTFARPVERVVFLATELDGVDSMGKRLQEVGVPAPLPGGEEVPLLTVPVTEVAREDWQALASRLRPGPDTLVVLDNLSQVIPDGATLNDDAVIRGVVNGLRHFTSAGSPVVLVHHTSDKRGATGRPSSKPMGHTSLNGAGRWTVYVTRKGSVLTLTAHGNDARREEMTVEQREAAADLHVVDEQSADDLARRGRERSDGRNARLAQMADFVQSHCAGLSKAEASRHLAAAGYGEARNLATQFVEGKPLGKLLAARGHIWA